MKAVEALAAPDFCVSNPEKVSMDKSKQADLIADVQVGKLDKHGNKVSSILATSNEYIVYEVDIPDTENRLKILSDGISDESENILVSRYHEIEGSYLTAKSLLYRANNYNLMKNRIADALASTFDGFAENPKLLFDNLTRFY